MHFYTYILFSPSLNRFYKGSTNNIQDRMLRHNASNEKFTKSGIPWTLLWLTKKQSRSEAYQLEMKLKNLSTKRTIDFMLKYQNDIAGPDELLLLKQLSGC